MISWQFSKRLKKGSRILSKAKKRQAKELEKLWRAGKYWEWVDLVRDAGLIKDYAPQWQEAWRSLSRLALRLPAYLTDFCQRLAGHPQAPELPDILLIRHLAEVLAGQPIPGDLAALTGLSPPAQQLRQRLLQWQPIVRSDRKLLRFAQLSSQRPEQVTGRFYKELADAVRPNPLAETCAFLATAINRLRRLNSKSERPAWTFYMDDRDWRTLNNRLETLCHPLEPSIRGVLLYPFCYQVWQCVNKAWEQQDFSVLVSCYACLPYLCSLTFGDALPGLLTFAQQHGEVRLTDRDLAKLLTDSRSKDLESKALALSKARKVIKASGCATSERLLDSFCRTYFSFLTDILKLWPSLSPRDRSDLQRVMDPILFADWKELQDESYVDEFIDLAILSGAGGARMSMLALFGYDLNLQTATRKRARENLRSLPYPGDQVIVEILATPEAIPFPEVHLFKPLFEAYPQETQGRRLIADKILEILSNLLWISAGERDLAAPARQQKVFQDTCRRSMAIFSKSLEALAEFPEMAPWLELADSFPEGYFTPAGYQRLLARVWQRSPDLSAFLKNMAQFFRSADLEKYDMGFIFAELQAPFQAILDSLLFDFLVEQKAALAAAPLATLAEIVDRFCFIDPRADERIINFFLHLGNILQGFIKAGERQAEILYDRIMDFVVASKKTSRAKRRRR